jgi:hypothetical protein
MAGNHYPLTAESLPGWVTKQHGLLWRSGTNRVFSCQCRAQPEPCAHMPTQEDRLCDHCRPGCGFQYVPGIGSVHVNKTGEVDCSQRMQALIDTIPPEGGTIYPDCGTYKVGQDDPHGH